MLLSVPPRTGISPYNGYIGKNTKKVTLHASSTPRSNSSSLSSSNSNGEQLSKTNLYIRGLHPGTTDQDLVKLCQP
uniref:RRM domain-containing protein n=1 Tax=Periophthalmus magnuspinnatus TaxID=409849 RepID=A0A3B4ARJ9_9GOBI